MSRFWEMGSHQSKVPGLLELLSLRMSAWKCHRSSSRRDEVRMAHGSPERRRRGSPGKPVIENDAAPEERRGRYIEFAMSGLEIKISQGSTLPIAEREQLQTETRWRDVGFVTRPQSGGSGASSLD
jgi:hypothetical protein